MQESEALACWGTNMSCGRKLFSGSSGPQKLNNGPESHSKSAAKAGV
jgi:hypothetical protein